MVNDSVKKFNKQVVKSSVKLTKDLKKMMPKEASEWIRLASFKNWIFLGILIVLSTIVVCSKNIYVLGIMFSIAGVHFIITKNITSALMSGVIVAILYLLFIRHKTDEMYKNRENLTSEKDETVVSDEDTGDDGVPKRTLRVKTDKDGELYVELPEDEEDEDEQEEELEDVDETEEKEMDVEAEETTETTKQSTDINKKMKESFESKNVVVKGAETCCSTPAPLK